MNTSTSTFTPTPASTARPASASTSMPTAAWCLRFATGPMRGRILALKPGLNVLGSAGACEIMLPGPDVRPRHLQLHAGDLALALQRVGDAPVRLNGVEVQSARRSLVVGDRLVLGATELQVDRAYAGEGRESAEADPMFLRESPVTVPAAAPSAIERASWTKALPVFVLAFALSLALFAWLLAAPSAPSTYAAAGPDLGALRRTLADYPEVEVRANADGRVEVIGFVESQLRRAALDAALRPFGQQAVVKVQLVDGLVERARVFVGDSAVAVSYAGGGRLVLSGATESAAVQSKIARLAEDLHPAVLVSDKVQYKPKPAAGGGADALWSSWQSLLPARVVSITQDADGMRHIQLANGHRYYEGALLKSGAQLEIVKPDELVITPEAAP